MRNKKGVDVDFIIFCFYHFYLFFLFFFDFLAFFYVGHGLKNNEQCVLVPLKKKHGRRKEKSFSTKRIGY